MQGDVEAIAQAISRRFTAGLPIGVDAAAVADRFAAFLAASLGTSDGLPAAARAVGRVCTVAQAATWLAGPTRDALHPESVRKRIREHTLVGVKTGDGHYVLPVWQFDSDGATLRPRPDVVSVWRSLPHDVASDRYLAAWMNTPKRSMQDRTVHEQAHAAGEDDPVVVAAVARLWTRLDPTAA